MLDVKKTLAKLLDAVKEETAVVDIIVFTRKGSTIETSGWGSMSLTSSYRTLGTLPTAFRPANTKFVSAIAGNSVNIPAIVRILPNGEVSVMASSSTNGFFSVSGIFTLHAN